MIIQINTDKHIDNTEELREYTEKQINKTLSLYVSDLTRVELHLSDRNADKAGAHDKRCVLEARPRGLQPVVARDSADTIEQAILFAAERMARLLQTTLGKRA